MQNKLFTYHFTSISTVSASYSSNSFVHKTKLNGLCRFIE